MIEKSNTKHVYDLEERTFQFAKNVRLLITKPPISTANIEDGKQVVRSSGSTGANYIEANESLSKKDFVYRIKVCRKEAKESAFFLRLLKNIDWLMKMLLIKQSSLLIYGRKVSLRVSILSISQNLMASKIIRE